MILHKQASDFVSVSGALVVKTFSDSPEDFEVVLHHFLVGNLNKDLPTL